MTNSQRNVPAIIGLLTIAALFAGCNRTPEPAADAGTTAAPGLANEKRWAKYQETNKRDMNTANAAFEKRQAQLEEKRRKAAGK